MPASHETVKKLPAVSGSSGRLVVEQVTATESEASWPGQVFADTEREYEGVMLEFVAASAPLDGTKKPVESVAESATDKAQKQALRQEEEQLRLERRTVRQQRQLEDAAWRTLKHAHRDQATSTSVSSSAERTVHDAHWQQIRHLRRQQLAQRNESDQLWKQKRLSLRQRGSLLPVVRAWIAILVITDNCTRQCLGLPLFVAGANVTAEMVVEALRLLLPPELLFLISDRGVHFRADSFRALLHNAELTHVPIARHRPQSNGIAERFVRSLKEWLHDKSWLDDHELSLLLERFVLDYNQRPHQGLPIPGLSPNEFANRIWLF